MKRKLIYIILTVSLFFNVVLVARNYVGIPGLSKSENIQHEFTIIKANISFVNTSLKEISSTKDSTEIYSKLYAANEQLLSAYYRSKNLSYILYHRYLIDISPLESYLFDLINDLSSIQGYIVSQDTGKTITSDVKELENLSRQVANLNDELQSEILKRKDLNQIIDYINSQNTVN